jgi:very-short-patch-repair endonuclease
MLKCSCGHTTLKQIKQIQFYRQKPIGQYIVDFYAPAAKMVIEIDGGQHFEEYHMEKDRRRDLALKESGLKVLRFDNFQVLQSIGSVLEAILAEIPSS